MKWEDWPSIVTNNIGSQGGTLVTLYPPGVENPFVSPTTINAQLVSPAPAPVTLASLPTEDPLVAGEIWNDDGTPTVSAG